MDGFQTYKLFLALKLHFTRPSYDIFKTNGAVKYSREQYNKRNDKLLFDTFAKKRTTDDVVEFLVSNLAYGNDTPIYDLDVASEYQIAWRKRKESITKVFQDDLTTIINDAELNKLEKSSVLDFTFNQLPSIITLYFGKKISIETLSILDAHLDLVTIWNQSGFMMKLVEKEIQKIQKTYRFIRYNKSRILPLIQSFEHDLNTLG